MPHYNAARRSFRIACCLIGAIGFLSSGCGLRKHPATPPVHGAVGRPTIELGSDWSAKLLRFSPDDRRLAGELEAAKDGEPAPIPANIIRVWDVRTGRQRMVSTGLFDACPVWLPDGSGIAFVTSSGDPTVDIVLARFRDRKKRTLRPIPITHSYHSWLSGREGHWLDDNTLVFYERTRQGTSRLRTWNRTTNTLGDLLSPPRQHAAQPSVSPDRRRLAYIDRYARPSLLVVIDLASKKPLYTSQPKEGSVIQQAWANTSDSLVYTSNEEKGWNLHRVLLRTGENTVLASVKGFAPYLTVNETKGYIAVEGTPGIDDIHSRLYIYDLQGRLLAVSPADIRASSPAWSNDGERIAYSASTPKPFRTWIFVADVDTLITAWKPK